MFDSTPSNLPIEPAQTPSSAPPRDPQPVPRAQSIQTPKPVLGNETGVREPEDIFSNVPDASIDTRSSSTLENTSVESQNHSGRSVGKIIIGVFVVLLLLGGIGGGVYYMLVIRPAAEEEARAIALTKTTNTSTNQVAQPLVNTPPVTETNPIQENTNLNSIENTDASNTQSPPSAPPNIPPPTPIVPPPVVDTDTSLSPPSIPNFTSTTDTDGDGLTDAEETILGTNLTIIDTDNDGFSDSAEIGDLYNPLEKAGTIMSLASIKVVRWAGVTFLMPVVWNLIDQTDVTATIQTQGGDRFILSMYDGGVASSILGTTLTTKNEFQAILGENGLSGDVKLPKTRFVLTPADPMMTPAFRTLIRMIIQSVRIAQ
ncbi:hypothetical protein IT408_04315 [Candidatus Uhrbacteria bacterium]|nr:hypothetical protein [Candidatus Uhrbacteria bacterium]